MDYIEHTSTDFLYNLGIVDRNHDNVIPDFITVPENAAPMTKNAKDSVNIYHDTMMRIQVCKSLMFSIQ